MTYPRLCLELRIFRCLSLEVREFKKGGGGQLWAKKKLSEMENTREDRASSAERKVRRVMNVGSGNANQHHLSTDLRLLGWCQRQGTRKTASNK